MYYMQELLTSPIDSLIFFSDISVLLSILSLKVSYTSLFVSLSVHIYMSPIISVCLNHLFCSLFLLSGWCICDLSKSLHCRGIASTSEIIGHCTLPKTSFNREKIG